MRGALCVARWDRGIIEADKLSYVRREARPCDRRDCEQNGVVLLSHSVTGNLHATGRAVYWEQPLRFAALSDVGFRRQNNQDAHIVVMAPDRETWQERGHLFVVADGMGGHAVGELASKIAVDTIPHTFDKLRQQHPIPALKAAIETANQTIFERGSQNREFLRMGTTCTTLLLGPLGAVIGHVGDSRLYRVRGKQIDQLTRDHSLVWELIEQRKVHPKDADRLYPRNVITRSLGPEQTVNVDMEGPSVVLPDDTFILCSDGLSTLVSDAEIGMIASELPPADAARMLVNLANLRGGVDNITVIVVEAGNVPDNAESVVMPAIPGPPEDWQGFILFCILSVVGMVGLGLLTLTDHRLVGAVLLGVVGCSGLLRLLRWTPAQPKPEWQYDPESRSTIIWRPYRTAPATVTPQFVQQLAKMEAELSRAALEEHWPIETTVRDDAFQKAQAAVQKKHWGMALREYARALNTLMVGVLWERNQSKHESRWGREPGRKKPAGKSPESRSD